MEQSESEELLKKLLEMVFETAKPTSEEDFKEKFKVFVDTNVPPMMREILKENNVEDNSQESSNDRVTSKETRRYMKRSSFPGVQEQGESPSDFDKAHKKCWRSIDDPSRWNSDSKKKIAVEHAVSGQTPQENVTDPSETDNSKARQPILRPPLELVQDLDMCEEKNPKLHSESRRRQFSFPDIPAQWQKLKRFVAKSPHPGPGLIFAYEDIKGKYQLEHCATFRRLLKRAAELGEKNQIRGPWKTFYYKDPSEEDLSYYPFARIPAEEPSAVAEGDGNPYVFGTVTVAGIPGSEKLVKLYLDQCADLCSLPRSRDIKNGIFTMKLVNLELTPVIIAKPKICEKEFPWSLFHVDLTHGDWYALDTNHLENFHVFFKSGDEKALTFPSEDFKVETQQDGGIHIIQRENCQVVNPGQSK